ncbi:MAG TPA: FHA domain-containing protein [Ktedonobacteraceae bacterium]|nr:FHA domain-containing protein [Ktedonobacteraceae bacterium]
MSTLESGHVFERYRVIRWLGSGVSGESYEAEDAMLMRKVTLKLIQPQSMLPDSARRQFFRELQGTSALNHPYLAPILDYGELNGRLYIARKFVSSGSLLGTEGRLWYRPPLNESDAIHYTHQLAQVLHYIHSRGYLHGAVTFSNILLQRGPNLNNEPDYAPFLLADVGLANFARRFGREQTAPLPITAAPEQLGKRITPASDQFALAVLLYFWLAGRPPYLGTPEEIEHLKLTETVTPLTSLNSRTTLEQSGILLRALSVYPEDRYPSVLAFAGALLKTLPPVMPPIAKTEPARFDGLTMPSPVPTVGENNQVADEREQEPILTTSASPVQTNGESEQEPVLAASPTSEEAIQTARDFDPEPYVTPVLASDTEPAVANEQQESPTDEPAPATQFGIIPETDPIIIFEPENVTVIEPAEAITPSEENEDQLHTPEIFSDVDATEAATPSEEIQVEAVSGGDATEAVTPDKEGQPAMPETVEAQMEQATGASASELEIPVEQAISASEPEAEIPVEQPVQTSVELAAPELQEVQPAQINGEEASGNGHYPSPEVQESVLESNHVEANAEQPLPTNGTQTAAPARIARVIITSPYEDQPYEMKLAGDEFTIGRAGSSSILLDQDNLTSRHHALLKHEGNRYLLFDMRSANGVFVNGQKIYVESEYELLDGDHISIGNYEMIFRSGASSQESDMPTDQMTPGAGYEISQLV